MLRLSMDDTWVKASLHCHSTASDGKLKPEEVVHYYLSRGYGLITITDHNKITTECGDHQKEMFLPGVEISKGKTKLGADYHIIAIGVNDPAIISLQSPSEVIDEVNSAGGVAIVAHPYWSSLVYEDLIALNGYIGIEIYNTGCDVEVAKGYSTVHWDDLVSSGLKTWGFAVDDAHRYSTPPIDADGGWIWLRATDQSPEAVIDSLKTGCFYSSTGPLIKELEMSEDSVNAILTPVTRVNLVSRNGTGLSIERSQLKNMVERWKNQIERQYLESRFDNVETDEKKGLTRVFLTGKDLKAEITHDRKGLRLLDIKARFCHEYMRLEVIDHYGRTAWSNPFFSSKDSGRIVSSIDL